MNDTSNLRDEGRTTCVGWNCDRTFSLTVDGSLCPHGEDLCDECWPGQCEPYCMVAAEEASVIEPPC
jgi:hypothetical protein